MSMMDRLAFLAPLLTLWFTVVAAGDCDFETVKECATGLYYYDEDGLVFSNDEEEYLKRCRHQLDSGDCLMAYFNRCLEPDAKELAKSFVRAPVYQILHLCHPHAEGDAKKVFKDSVPCHNSIFPKLQDCARDYAFNVEYAAGQRNERVPRFCCGYNDYVNCVVAASQSCNLADQAYFSTILHGYLGDILGRVCSNSTYGNDPSKCQEVPGRKRTGNEPRPNQVRSLIKFVKALTAVKK